MSTPEPPSPDDENPQSESETTDDSVVTPPSYPAYSTPPPEGLPDAEHS